MQPEAKHQRAREAHDRRRYVGIVRRAQRRLLSQPPRSPVYTTPCYGRETELQTIEHWYNASESPLLTLTGESGIGKTHLANEFLHRSRLQGHPCLYLNLTHLGSPDRLLDAVFHALDLPFSANAPWRWLLNSVFRRRCLLVLDDFAGLLPEGAQWVQALIQAAPQLKVLATSQQPLQVAGEQVLPLAPLPTPPPDRQVRSLDELRAYAGAAVLLEQVGSPTRLAGVNPGEVARVCRDLGGHPGRLVDAGLYLRQYSWSEFYRQYRAWFGLQPGTAPLLNPALQRHLLFHALRREEQRMMQCLTVFRDTFSRETAAVAMQKTPDETTEFLALLQARGFVQVVAKSSSLRYQLAPRVCEVITPLTEAQHHVVMQRLHAYYAQELQAAIRRGDPVPQIRAWCFEESAHLVAVLESLKQHQQVQAISALIHTLVQGCGSRPPAQVMDWGIAYVVDAPGLPSEERVRLARLIFSGLIDSGLEEYAEPLLSLLESEPESALMVGRYWHNIASGDRARQGYRMALARAQAAQDRVEAVRAAVNLAESEAVIGNLREAEKHLREVEARYPLYRMPSEVRWWYYYVAGYTHYQRGHFRRSRELYWKALEHAEWSPDVLRELSRVELERGDYLAARDCASLALELLLSDPAERHEPSIHALEGCLGDVAAVEGRYDEAFSFHYPSLEYWRRRRQRRWICWTLNRLVEIELLARDAGVPWRLHEVMGVEAHRLLAEAWRVIEPTYMNLPHKSRTLHNLGWLAWHEGRLAEAETHLAQALGIRTRYGNEYGVARTQEILARVRFDQGRYQEAAQLFRWAAQTRAQLRVCQYPAIKRCSLSVQKRLKKALRSTG